MSAADSLGSRRAGAAVGSRAWRAVGGRGQFGRPMAVGQEAVVADAWKARGQVLQETADELFGGNSHDFGFACVPVIFPGRRLGRVPAPAGGGWRWPRDGCSGPGIPARGAGRQRGAWRRPPIIFAGAPGSGQRRLGRVTAPDRRRTGVGRWHKPCPELPERDGGNRR